MSKASARIGNPISNLIRDCRANAAIEFAVIVPLMLTMFFGLVEFSSALAAKSKVTLAARNLSDLVSQASAVNDTDLNNFNATSKAIMTPYLTADFTSRVTEVYVDPATLVGKVKWSKGWGMTSLTSSDTVQIPTSLQVGGTYLIFGEINHKYTPAVGYVMKAAVPLSDATFTRPRQSLCVYYNPTMTTC